MLKQIVWKTSTGCNNLAYYNVVVRALQYGTLCCQGHCNSRKAWLMGTSIGLTLMKPMCALWQHVYGIWKGATGFPTRVGILSIKNGLECWRGVWPWNMTFGADFWSEHLESCLGVGFCPYFSEGIPGPWLGMRRYGHLTIRYVSIQRETIWLFSIRYDTDNNCKYTNIHNIHIILFMNTTEECFD